MRLSFAQTMALDLVGGYSGSIFLKAEALLEDHVEALRYVAHSKNMDRYRSMMDFLFCEVACGAWRLRCEAFYNEKGKPLREVLTIQEILAWDAKLTRALRFAIDSFEADRKPRDWTQFRFLALRTN